MRGSRFFLIILTLIIFISINFSGNLLQYSDPCNNSKFVNTETAIIFKFYNNIIENVSVVKKGVSVTGNLNGNYSFSLLKSGDVYILKTNKPFAAGENITVSFNNFRCTHENKLCNDEFKFTVSRYKTQNIPLIGLKNEIPDEIFSKLISGEYNYSVTGDLPEIVVQYSDNPAPGNLFLSNIVFNVAIPNVPHLLILNNDATPLKFKEMQGQIFDFNRQPNGRFTYFNRVGGKYYEIDSNFIVTDSFYTGNGYFTDIHELRVLPNRHALLLSYDRQVIDMSTLVTGGDTAALVTGIILQEIDENKNVVFQWKSWDHIPVTDAVHEDLTAHEIDYMHSNAIELDNDGNIIISSRHLDEITKINRTTGDIIWRLGGKHNQFSFINDPGKFTYQHGIRRLQNGNIIMFDNGNFHTPPKSRAVEYSLDEANRIVTKVWEYSNNPVIFGYAMGFAQRLPDGNTLISWGSTNPTFTEVRPDGSKTLQMNLKTGVFSYRVFKYKLESGITQIQPESNNIPDKYKLYQNYPNPFNPSAIIKYDIPNDGFTQISIYDYLGRMVKQLVSGDIKKGSYSLNVDLSDVSAGVYFYRIKSGNFTDTKKMILIK